MCVRRPDSQKGTTMKTIARVSLITALALTPAVKAQQPSYEFRSVVQPGAIIGGRTFIAGTTIGSVALSDAGEAAFIASETGPAPKTVFTTRRIVARQGDEIGGKIIVLLADDAVLQINEAGQVAFEAWYADTREKAASREGLGRGIFVDNRLVFTAPFDAELPAFTLAEDGRIVLHNPTPAPAAAKAKSDIIGRIRIKPPKDSPVSIKPVPIEVTRPGQRKPAVIARPLPFPVNHRGQILIPVNFRDGGFLLLLGTPRERRANAEALENDPEFQRLTPAGKEFVRQMAADIDRAIEGTRQQLGQPGKQ